MIITAATHCEEIDKKGKVSKIAIYLLIITPKNTK